MYHNRAFRKLGRKHSHRLATLRALSTALFERERIQTTLMKAKELRPFAEKLITRSKRDDLHARRLILRHIHDRDVARKLFETLSARYMERNGGYMRILKLGRRQGDGAEMALVELLGSEPVFKKQDEGRKKRPGLASRLMRRGAKAEAAGAAEETAAAAGAEAEGAEPAPEESPKKKGSSKAASRRTSKGAGKKK
ncbi:MAG TPA: 50S ribosomal protein L17 [Candidatus Polarisedimenticolia bacterium]|nr:50S ribosomal protein L17 [Candidatus Polarisedimenticolia bacterium]